MDQKQNLASCISMNCTQYLLLTQDGLRLLFLDERLRSQLIMAFTEDDRLHFEEVASLLEVGNIHSFHPGDY